MTAARGETTVRDVARELLVALPMPILVILGSALGVPAITLLGAVGTLGLAVISPTHGLIALAFLAPTKPLLILPAPGFIVFLVAALVAGYVFRLPLERPRLRFGPLVLLVLGIAVYAFVQQLPAMLAGYGSDEAHRIGYKFFQYSAAIGTVLVAAVLLQGRRPYAILAALLGSAVFVAVLALATFDVSEPSGLVANLIPDPDEGARATGSFGNPNYYGFFIAMATVLSVSLLSLARGRRVRIALLLVLIILGVSLLLSLSRGAMTALTAGMLTLAFLRSPRAGFVSLFVVVFSVVVLYPLFVEFRAVVMTGGVEAVERISSSDAGRLEAVLSGPVLWLTSPVLGVGFGRYVFESAQVLGGDGVVAHNWYMTVLAEQGLVGIGLWILLLVGAFTALRRRPHAPRTVGLAVLVAAATGFMFLQPPTAFQSAALPAIAIVAALVAKWSDPAVDAPLDPDRRRGDLVVRTG